MLTCDRSLCFFSRPLRWVVLLCGLAMVAPGAARAAKSAKAAAAPFMLPVKRASALFLSHNRATVAVRERSKSYSLWDMASQKKLGAFRAASWSHTLALSPDGKRAALLTGYFSPVVTLMDNKGKTIATLKSPLRSTKGVFMPNPDTLMLYNRKKAGLYSFKGKEHVSIRFKSSVQAAFMVDDLKTFVFVQRDQVVLWNAKTKATSTVKTSLKASLMATSADKKSIALAGKYAALLIGANAKGEWKKIRKVELLAKRPKELFFLDANSLACKVGYRKYIIFDAVTGGVKKIKSVAWGSALTQLQGGTFLMMKRGKGVTKVDWSLPKDTKPIHIEGLGYSPTGNALSSLAWLPPVSVGGLFAAQSAYQLVVGDTKGQVGIVTFSPQAKGDKLFQYKALTKLVSQVGPIATSADGTKIAITTLGGKQVRVFEKEKKSATFAVGFAIEAMALALQGSTLVAGGKNGQLAFFDAKTGKRLRKIAGHQSISRIIRTGPKGGWVLIDGGFKGKSALLHDVATGDILTAHSQFANVMGTDIDPTGRWLLINSNGGGTKIRDLKKGKEHVRASPRPGKNEGGVIDPQRRTFAVPARNGMLNFYSLHTGKLLKAVRMHWGDAFPLWGSGDGEMLAGMIGPRLRLIPVPDFKVKPLPAEAFQPKPIKFALKQTLIAQMKRDIRSFVAFGKKQEHIALSATYNRLDVFVDAKKRISKKVRFYSYHSAVAAPGDASWVLAGFSKGRLFRYDHAKKTFRQWSKNSRHLRNLKRLSVDRTGRWIAVGRRRSISIFENVKDKLVYRTSLPTRRGTNKLVFHPILTHILAASSDDDSVRVWDVKTGKKLWSAKRSDDINGIAFHPHGTELAVIDEDGMVGVYEAMKGKVLKNYTFGNRFLDGYDLAYRTDGRVIVAGFEGGLLGTIDRNTHNTQKLKALWSNITGLEWLKNGTLLVNYGAQLFKAAPPKGLPPVDQAAIKKADTLFAAAAKERESAKVAAPPATPPTKRTTKVTGTQPITTTPTKAGRAGAVFNGSSRLVTMSRNRLYVAYVSAGRIVVRQARTGKVVRAFATMGRPKRIRLHPYGNYVGAKMGPRRLLVWNVKTGKRATIRTSFKFYQMSFAGQFVMLRGFGRKAALYNLP